MTKKKSPTLKKSPNKNLEENIPELSKIKSECYVYSLNYIHGDLDFKDFIESYKSIMTPSYFKRLVHTSKFMFENVGYGIFICLKNGKIHTFQPFANIYDEKKNTNNLTLNDIELFYQQKIKDLKITKNKLYHRIVKARKQWVVSGCNFFYWNDWWKDFEGYIHTYYDLLINSIKNPKINTCFFINLFDLPVMNKKECIEFMKEDFEYKNCNTKNIHKLFIPVLSACTTKLHFDDLNIFPDAWELVSQKKFGNNCRELYYNVTKDINTNWVEKTNKIVFRGRNTSCHPNDFNRNIRLKVSEIVNDIISDNESIKDKSEKINIKIDVGLNALTTNTLYYNNKLTYSNPKYIQSRIKLKEGIPMTKQSNFKYILDMDGFVTPWRLCFELSYNSCIILIMSEYISWFYDKLDHKKNIFMINQYTDVKQQLKDSLVYFSQNDKEAERIANGSLELYKKIMNLEYIIYYMTTKLSDNYYNMNL